MDRDEMTEDDRITAVINGLAQLLEDNGCVMEQRFVVDEWRPREVFVQFCVVIDPAMGLFTGDAKKRIRSRI